MRYFSAIFLFTLTNNFVFFFSHKITIFEWHHTHRSKTITNWAFYFSAHIDLHFWRHSWFSDPELNVVKTSTLFKGKLLINIRPIAALTPPPPQPHPCMVYTEDKYGIGGVASGLISRDSTNCLKWYYIRFMDCVIQFMILSLVDFLRIDKMLIFAIVIVY